MFDVTSVGRMSSRLFGRESELVLLREYFAAAIAGNGKLVLVSGEAGIGKTALVQAFAHEAAKQHALFLSCNCYDLTATPPYGPWIEITERYSADGALPPVPEVLKQGTGMGEVADQGELFKVVYAFLAAVSRQRPFVLILEDMHWSDRASLDLLRFVGRQLIGQCLLIVATYRDDEVSREHHLSQLVPILVREAKAERLDLRPLTAPDVDSLLRHRYRLNESGYARLGTYLQARGDGNPLFIRELLRTLEEGNHLRQEGSAWLLNNLRDVPTPRLLRQVIERRLRHLMDEYRGLLEVASVIGQQIPLDLWQRVSQASDETIIDVTEEAVEANLLAETAPDHSVSFTHALIREALYAGIILPRRRKLHQAIAEVLMRGPARDPDEVAYHLQQAGDERAVEWLVHAGDRAQRSFAWQTAAERFESALGLLERIGSNFSLRGWLCYRIGRLYRFTEPIRGARYLERAEQFALECNDQVLAAFAITDRGLMRNHAGDMERGIAESLRGNRELDGLLSRGISLDVALEDWVTDSLRVSSAGSSIADLEPLHAVDTRRGGLVLHLAKGGFISEALEFGASFAERLESITLERDLVKATYADLQLGYGSIYAMLCEVDEARRAFSRARETLYAIRHFAMLRSCPYHELLEVIYPFQTTNLDVRKELQAISGGVDDGILTSSARIEVSAPDQSAFYLPFLLLEGRWDEASEVALSSLEAQLIDFRSNAVVALGRLARERRDTELGWQHVAKFMIDGPSTKFGTLNFARGQEFQRLAFDLALDADDGDAAQAWLDAYDQWLDQAGAIRGRAESSLMKARYHRCTGDLDSSRQDAERALVHATDPEQPLALIAAHRFLGELETEQRHFAEAEDHLRESLRVAGACAAPYERALSLLALAELYAKTGKPEEATSALNEAIIVCESLGARPALERAHALFKRLGTHGTRPVYPAGLTCREAEVLRLIAQGMSDKDIAEALFISHHTVMRHVSHILGKLAVESRSAAAAEAVRLGLA